jgi:PhzF family phenazine biosynthesis protein
MMAAGGEGPPKGAAMAVPLFKVDAFTSEPFKGNPAAVVLLEYAERAPWMQNVAMEMGLSETAFLWPEGEGYHIRWFTPKVEVELCGHATLASAHVLFGQGLLKHGQEAHFRSLSGPLRARQDGHLVELDFPAKPPQPIKAPPRLAEALGAEPIYVGTDGSDYLALFEEEGTVRNLAPHMALLTTVETRGVCVTAKSHGHGYDFVSRFFAPTVGIPEDPVTGSAHCCLGPFWAERLGQNELRAYQASARGGSLRVRVEGKRVFIAGPAVTIFKGELLV